MFQRIRSSGVDVFRMGLVTALLVLGAARAEAAFVSIVNLDTWQGGEPTAEDLDGVNVVLGQTARIGVVVELMNGTYSDNGTIVQNPNQLATAIIFLNGTGDTGTVRLVDVGSGAINDAGEPWHEEAYSTGMFDWVTDIRNGPPNPTPAPLLENYHLIAFDDTASCPQTPGHMVCGGNSYGNAAHRIVLLSEITIEPILCCGQTMGVVFAQQDYTEFWTNDSRQYELQTNDSEGHGGNSFDARGGYMVMRNGRNTTTAFRIRMNPGDGGACCITAGECEYQTEANCNAAGGRFIGVGENCATQVASTTIIEPGGEIFVHVIGVELVCPDPDRAIECVEQPYKIDPWTSRPHALMCQRFDVAGSPPIPAGFFGDGSNPFSSPICLEGEPLGDTPYGDFGQADTLIRRPSDPFSRCDIPSSETRSVPLQVAALNLRAPDPINVTYAAGPSQLWNVTVDLSEVYTDANPNNDPPPGTLWATKTHCNGGTYTSLLPVQARFHFTRVDNPGDVRILDTGLAGLPPVELDGRATPLPWVTEVGASIALINPVCTDFHPGVLETQTTQACDCDHNGVHDGCQEDCNDNNRADPCDIALNANLDCNVNQRIDACDISSGSSSDADQNQIPDECQCTTNAQCVTGDFCTGNRACVANVCRTTTTVCPAGLFCDEEHDSCVECLIDAQCADSAFCNGAEPCVSGECLAGAPPCAAGEHCVESQDRCVECLTTAECNDGEYCTGAESCVQGECVSAGDPCPPVGKACDEQNDRCVCASDEGCDDGLFCNGPEHCNGVDCLSPGDPCAAGGLYCDETGGACVECLTATHCQDGVYCNGAETCAGGACQAASDPCAALGLVCDEAADTCRCDDSGDCADGLYCNGPEVCEGGLCRSLGDPCTAPNPFCVESTDSCVECRTTADCGDGLFCTGGEVCAQNQCQSTGDPCAALGLACDEAHDACACNDDGDCDDGAFCNGPEHCTGGACSSAGNPCLAAGLACNEGLNLCYDCVTTEDCNDGFFCNGFEACVNGLCATGQAQCADSHCSEAVDGCVECTTNAHCDDGLFCNGAERCNGGQCVAGARPCAAELCVESTDRCMACTTDAHCDDHSFCNGAERCVAGACAAGAAPCPDSPCSDFADECVPCTSAIHCDDDDPCTIDTCEAFACRSIRRQGCDPNAQPLPTADDHDGDGVRDDVDLCANSRGVDVDEFGCACDQRDTDGDGVNDCADHCPDTPPGTPHDVAGCSAAQRDGDGDGVSNTLDRCPQTPPGSEVDGFGCTVGEDPPAGQDDPAGAADEGGGGTQRSAGCGLFGWVQILMIGVSLRLLPRKGKRRMSNSE